MDWNSIDELNKFRAKISQFHPSIKVDFNYSNNTVNFLDTRVKRFSTGELLTTLL